MIRSMTGFGRCEQSEETRKIIIEMKAVNHRYLDANFKMPKKFAPLEIKMRNVLKQYVLRGKVDVFVTYEDLSEGQEKVIYNKELAKTYYDFLCEMADDFQIQNDIKVSHLSRYPDIFTVEEVCEDEEELWQIIEPTLKGALESFVEARQAEGQRLYEDMIAKLDDMSLYIEAIEKHAPELIKQYRTNLESKVQELLENATMDDTRIAQEVVLYADKVCIDEEIVRLKSHIQAVKDILNKEHKSPSLGEGVGRKLDFLAQEMNREANTILSKSTDVSIADQAIELKTNVEKIREQIQNME